MDVRLSPEQVTLRDAARQVVDRLCPQGVAQLDDAERAAKLDAAVVTSGWRELRTSSDDGGPWASAVEVAVVAEELGRGLADTAFLGPTMAADLRRLAGAPPATTPETIALGPDLSEPAVAPGPLGLGAVALDAQGATSALVLLPEGDRYAIGTITVGHPTAGVDLTRSWGGVPARAPGSPRAVRRCHLWRG
jgi:alkylation response protein AidB-like acyl-CoA dehydrogenase